MGSIDRRPYLREGQSLTQSLLNECSSNLTNKLEMICMIFDLGTSNINIFMSDRAKYVKLPGEDGFTFFQPRVTFPQISRTMGDFLSNTLELSSLQITINNADQYFNTIMPGGDYYEGFVNKVMIVQVGIGELGENYHTVFYGQITKVGGFSRDYKSFQLTAKNKFDVLNTNFPNEYLLQSEYAYLDDDLEGTPLPYILGDWTVALRRGAPCVPGYVLNGKNPLVNSSVVDENGDPDPNVGTVEVQVAISINELSFVSTGSVVLIRQDLPYRFRPEDVTILHGLGNRIVLLSQMGMMVNPDDPKPWIYEDGDQFYFAVKGIEFEPGINLGNPIRQAKELLNYYAPQLEEIDYDATWNSYITRLTAKGWLTRVWVQEQQPLLEYILSLFEQIRIESFINNDNKVAISSLWFEDFNPSPSFRINNWDIIKGTFKPRIEDRNVFNSAKADYGFDPSINKNRFSTAQYSNELAVTQMDEKIAKLIVFPNMYDESHVLDNLQEILRLVPYIEYIECSVTPRSVLLELGDNIGLRINIGGFNLMDKYGVVYNDMVTGIIRNIGFDPSGMAIPIKVWMLQMVSFPGSLKNDVTGKISGYNIVITKD